MAVENVEYVTICFLGHVSVIRILHVNEVLIELKEWKRKQERERERKREYVFDTIVLIINSCSTELILGITWII